MSQSALFSLRSALFSDGSVGSILAEVGVRIALFSEKLGGESVGRPGGVPVPLTPYFPPPIRGFVQACPSTGVLTLRPTPRSATCATCGASTVDASGIVPRPALDFVVGRSVVDLPPLGIDTPIALLDHDVKDYPWLTFSELGTIRVCASTVAGIFGQGFFPT